MLKYRKYSEDTKDRVVKRYLDGGDWKLTASEHGVPLSTVRSWVKERKTKESQNESGGASEKKKRGGKRHVKITSEHKVFWSSGSMLPPL
jgi:transposase-like protein